MQVLLKTSAGDITLSLDTEGTPNTADNFVQYVKSGHYDNCIFHRVIEGFMIQGGGFDADMNQKETRDPIQNEGKTGKGNKRGSIAMARTFEPHSASAQFFINHKDNAFLDFKAETPDGWGYCVFGEVTDGMDVVDAIAKVETGNSHGHQDVPTTAVIIESATCLDA